MSNLRQGRYGNYYGSFLGESSQLAENMMKTNATYIYSYLTNNGWSINAISAIIGNMQAESSINPGRWQNDNVGSTSNGYGLVQWTPSTNYTEWAEAQGIEDHSTMDANLSRIIYEVENGLQWIRRTGYDISFSEFTKSSQSVSYLAKAFLLCYERPADQSDSVQNYRASISENWYTYLSGETPVNPINPISTKAKKKYNFLLFNARRRREQWIR